MASRPVVSSVLGHQAERAGAADVAALTQLLRYLDARQWRAPARGGVSVAEVVAHLAEGTMRLSEAWRRRLDAEADEALLHTFDDASGPPAVEMETSDPSAVLSAYRAATAHLRQTLGTVLERDWWWPVWSPLGGAETLGEAARRWLAHHHVHRWDVHQAIGRPLAAEEETTRLAAEFALEALARRGADQVVPPLTLGVVTGPPGAGTWSVIFERPRPRAVVDSVWEELIGHHPEALESHRVEHGSSEAARLRIRTDGQTLWRAAFAREAAWHELEIHGDDEARAAWDRLVAAVAGPAATGLRPLQH